MNSRQINLTNWYPFVVPFIGGQWTLHPVWYYGEELVYDAADFKVNLKFSDSTPPPVVASSGELVATSADGTATYTLTAGRAFVFSMSPDFQVDSTKVGDVTVYSYYYDYSSFDIPGRLSLTTTAQALQIYSQRYGPYPHKTLSVIMGNFPDGMEYSASYFTSYGYYNLLAGSPTNSIYQLSVVYLAAHETAHQWWFEQVANDQALEPWLDEAMATYSEHVFFETYYPAELKLWWYVRSDQYDPKGWVDIPIYDGGGFRPYTNAVYFEGAHFLDDLRTRIGDQAFFAFLQDYLNQENGKISTSADFFRILRTHTQVDFSDLDKKIFQEFPLMTKRLSPSVSLCPLCFDVDILRASSSRAHASYPRLQSGHRCPKLNLHSNSLPTLHADQYSDPICDFASNQYNCSDRYGNLYHFTADQHTRCFKFTFADTRACKHADAIHIFCKSKIFGAYPSYR